MIIRVLHEGQYELDGQVLNDVNALDQQLFTAVVEGDSDSYNKLFQQVLELIRGKGRALGVDDLRPSDLVLPAPDSTADEVRQLFQGEGLITA